MEIMDALAIEAAEAAVKPGYPEGAALLIVELEGEREVVDADAARLARAAARVGRRPRSRRPRTRPSGR